MIPSRENPLRDYIHNMLRLWNCMERGDKEQSEWSFSIVASYSALLCLILLCFLFYITALFISFLHSSTFCFFPGNVFTWNKLDPPSVWQLPGHTTASFMKGVSSKSNSSIPATSVLRRTYTHVDKSTRWYENTRMHTHVHAHTCMDTHTRSICLCLPPTAITTVGLSAKQCVMLRTTRMLTSYDEHFLFNTRCNADFYA